MNNIHQQSSADSPKITRLKQECVTRWNSAYIMYDSIIICSEGIRIVITGDAKVFKDHGQKLLLYEELKLLTELRDLLKPFYEFTVLMGASEYATSSIILPGVTQLLEILKIEDHSPTIRPVADALYDDLEARSLPYFDNKSLLAATFLDSRYKYLTFIK